jgi:hypothetical protein
MAITSYPRVTINGTSPSQNPPNGQGLMLLNPSTGLYEPATASTFSGGGGSDATASNQTIQIAEAQTTNQFLFDGGAGLSVAQLAELIRINTFENNANKSVAELLYDTSKAQSVSDVLQVILGVTESINKTTKWNTFSSKIYHNGSGTTTFALNSAVRIVFHDSVVVNDLLDDNGNSVASTYFVAEPTGTDYTTAANGEIICIGNNASDLFADIEVVGKCTFTAYYLITPYV